MPSNHILINNSIEYIVVDSKMGAFLQWLEQNGNLVDTGIKKESDMVAKEATSCIQIVS